MKDKPQMFNHVFIDGDILAYRASFSAQGKEVGRAYSKVDELANFILQKTVVFSSGNDYTVGLTGRTNFRDSVAKTVPYKGNRVSGDRPEHLDASRDYLLSKYEAIVSVDEEADDIMSKGLTKDPERHVIASIDKDMLQVPGWHFNFTRNEWHYSTIDYGNRFFYTQILTGDNIDNIIGLYRVGPAKANKILGDATTEQDLYDAVLKAYDGNADRVLENARLLWLRRYDNEMWLPPHERKQ